jgi:hypothetical protein
VTQLARGASRTYIGAMRKITITAQAFDAIAQALPLGSAAVKTERAEDGSVGIWLPRSVVAKLKSLRAPGESYSSVILRLASGATAGRRGRTLRL